TRIKRWRTNQRVLSITRRDSDLKYLDYIGSGFSCVSGTRRDDALTGVGCKKKQTLLTRTGYYSNRDFFKFLLASFICDSKAK
ncbi:unnamed protein product, partial [Trichogramma brassicae]